VKTIATGTLTLHGVTRDVAVPVQARWTADRIEVVGSLPIRFADYGIQTPNIGGFVTVEDQGTMEFQLFFQR
jgi:polyisoprenoid-binding protein YceI